MNIINAQKLAEEKGFELKRGLTQWDWDLYSDEGDHIDTLHTTQIQYLAETDYVEFYLS